MQAQPAGSAGSRPFSTGGQAPAPRTNISNVQMEQVKGTIKSHLEKHKFFDSLKTAVAKDPKLAKVDRNTVIDRLKSEGILSDIIQNLPNSKRAGMNASASGSLSISES